MNSRSATPPQEYLNPQHSTSCRRELSHQTLFRHARGFRQHTYYINRLPWNLVLGFRSGLRGVIPPSIAELRKSAQADFVIRECYELDAVSTSWFRRYLDTHGTTDLSSEEFSLLAAQLPRYDNTNGPFHTVLMLDYGLNRKAFEQSCPIYLAVKDLLLYREPESNQPHPSHPYQLDSLAKSQCAEIGKRYQLDVWNDQQLTISFELVDNEQCFAPKFLNMAGQINRLQPSTSVTKTSGLYLTTVQPSRTDPVQTKRYELQEAKELLGLHESEEAALAYGDVNARQREEFERYKLEEQITIATIKQETLLETQTLERERREFQRLQLEADQEKSRLEAIAQEQKALREKELQQLENERLRLQDEYERAKLRYQYHTLHDKEFYEQRERARKDSSETLRMLPVLASAALALFAWFQKAPK